MRLHGTGDDRVKEQFLVFGHIGAEEEGGSSFDAGAADEDQDVDEGDGQEPSDAESSEDENEGPDETITSYSQTQMR